MRKSLTITLFLLLIALVPRAARAYSVLSHEQTVDMAWDKNIVPLLMKRYPGATPDQLRVAHAYAYGGCIIQDLGYYPFGSHQFSDLLHYVRTGDFVNNLLRDADNLNDYAFALGALAHYDDDSLGHPAINRATAREYPKLRARFGPIVTYDDSPKDHIRTEFGFDVVQVAQGHYVQDNYQDFIGFQVDQPLLERAFLETYGVPLNSVLTHEDMAIGSYRYSVGTLIPEMTRAAVVNYGKQMREQVPNFNRKRFVYRLSRADYERNWGKKYRRPGLGARFLAFLMKILPKVGPLSALKPRVPSAADQKDYLDSMQATANQFDQQLTAMHRSQQQQLLDLPDLNLDTGKNSAIGQYPLADSSYAQLLNALAHSKQPNLTPALRTNILAYYASAKPSSLDPRQKRDWQKIDRDLVWLRNQKPGTQSAQPQSTLEQTSLTTNQ